MNLKNALREFSRHPRSELTSSVGGATRHLPVGIPPRRTVLENGSFELGRLPVIWGRLRWSTTSTNSANMLCRTNRGMEWNSSCLPSRRRRHGRIERAPMRAAKPRSIAVASRRTAFGRRSTRITRSTSCCARSRDFPASDSSESSVPSESESQLPNARASRSFTSASKRITFTSSWRRRIGSSSGAESSPVAVPRTWFARTGWKRHGLVQPEERPA